MKMNHQEIFNKVLDALRKQGHASINKNGSCMYRAENGDRCAVGHLISDEAYSPELEGRRASTSPVQSALASSGVPTDFDTIKLLMELQFAHDRSLKEYGMSKFESRMSDIAIRFSLNYTPV
jgi:hypothetical protein